MSVLDFSGLDSVNSSYIKGTAFWLFICGQLTTKGPGSHLSPRHPADPRPYELYVCVAGLSPEVVVEFQEFLKPRELPMLYARRLKGEAIEEAVLLGYLDPTLRQTLKAIAAEGRTTAPALHQSHSDEDVTVTAWNNRLNDLHSFRLVRRVRAGRAWEYEAIAKKIIWE